MFSHFRHEWLTKKRTCCSGRFALRFRCARSEPAVPVLLSTIGVLPFDLRLSQPVMQRDQCRGRKESKCVNQTEPRTDLQDRQIVSFERLQLWAAMGQISKAFRVTDHQTERPYDPEEFVSTVCNSFKRTILLTLVIASMFACRFLQTKSHVSAFSGRSYA